MSKENVEIVRQANEAFNKGDLDGAFALWDPDAELLDLGNAPDQPPAVKGVDAIREALTLWTATFDQLRADIEEYTEADRALICAVHWHGQGKASGISIDVRQDLYEFSDGKIARATLGYRSKEDALEAAGQRE